MKRTIRIIGRLGLGLSLLVVIGFLLDTKAQTLQDCKANLETARQLIDNREKRIENLNEQLQNRVAKADALQEKIDALNEVIGELRKQIDLQAANNATLQDSLHLQQTIMESRQQAIADRDLLIKELVKANKRSALEKIVESLPSLASIIAIAITAR
jgi:peptidoglycan hydrolase CwlO-like protein